MPYTFDAATGLITPGVPAPAAPQAFGYGFGGSGYEAAQTSSKRNGFWGLPSVASGGPDDPDIDSYSLAQLRNMSDAFHKNSGFVKRLFNGTARYAIGRGIIPFATTRDKAWNEEAEDYFDDWARSRGQFSVCGRQNFYTSQKLMARGTFRLGAMLALRTTTLGGAKPQLQFIEPQRLGGKEETGKWVDGQKISPRGRTLAYRFLKPGSTDRERILDANKISHLYDPERGCQTHGRPWLSFGLHKLADYDEIESAATAGVKLDQAIGFLRKTDAPDGGPAFGAENTVSAVTDGDGGIEYAAVTVEDIYGSAAIPTLRPGEDIESYRSEKPSERLEAWLAFHLRNLCWGFGCSPELAWNITGVGGAPMRWILQDGQLFFEEVQNLLIERYCDEVWRYRIGHGISTGELRVPEGARAWWHRPGWISPQKVTVDIGRDGKLSIELIKNGLLSIPRYYRALGLDWQDELAAQMDALEWIKKEAATRENLDASEIMEALPGAGTAAFADANLPKALPPGL